MRRGLNEVMTQLRDGRPGLDSRQGQEFLLFATAFGPVLGTKQPPIQWLPG